MMCGTWDLGVCTIEFLEVSNRDMWRWLADGLIAIIPTEHKPANSTRDNAAKDVMRICRCE